MDLLTRLQNDMKTAMKAGQKQRLGVIRMLISDVRNIDLSPQPTTPEQTVAAYAKKLGKSRQEYEKLGRKEEVEALSQELAIVEEYLPQKASSEQTEAIVDAFLARHAYTSSQIGQAMGALMKAHGQEIDPAAANALLRKKLTAQ